MANYFTDEDQETRDLIEECTEGMDDAVKADYLVNVLCLKYLQSKTVYEVFTAELKSKKNFEEELASRRKNESSMPS